MMNPKQLFVLFRRAAQAWSDDFAPSMGAAISYYTVFSLAPLLVIVIAIAGAVFGREAVQGQVVAQLGGLIGKDGAELVQGLIAAASDKDKGLVAGIVSAVVLLVGATTVFAELQSALDRIWHVPPSQKPKGLRAMVRARLLSFGLILGLVFLLMVSLAVSTAVAAFGAFTTGLVPGAEALLQVINAAVSVGIATLLFAMIYKLMPSTRIAWRDVWVGALATALLFEVGKFLIGLYLGKSSMTESFAAAGSLVVLIAWVYYASQIFLMGAEFTKVYAQAHGSHAAQVAMAGTGETARTGVVPETAGDAGQPAPALAEDPAAPQAAPMIPTKVTIAAVPAAARLEETRGRMLQPSGEAPPARPLFLSRRPRLEAVLAGVSALAGMALVAGVRRALRRRRNAGNASTA